jgi:hypothetical protein
MRVGIKKKSPAKEHGRAFTKTNAKKLRGLFL